ncbi:unnamed protein product, partial [Meganyctiphanes norvegica]
ITGALGGEYIESIVLNLESTWEESDCYTPFICFLSTGSDPTVMIEALAKSLNMEYHSISMGQGQEAHASSLMEEAMKAGHWLLLQNCHLSLNFCQEIFVILSDKPQVNKNFRLWITTEIHEQFPIGLLQISIKFTNEPPQGIRASLTRTYANVSQDMLDYCNTSEWPKLLYATAFLHTVVQERRKFGALGWNIPYEFNQADFQASIQFIQNHLDDLDVKK